MTNLALVVSPDRRILTLYHTPGGTVLISMIISFLRC